MVPMPRPRTVGADPSAMSWAAGGVVLHGRHQMTSGEPDQQTGLVGGHPGLIHAI